MRVGALCACGRACRVCYSIHLASMPFRWRRTTPLLSGKSFAIRMPKFHPRPREFLRFCVNRMHFYVFFFLFNLAYLNSLQDMHDKRNKQFLPRTYWKFRFLYINQHAPSRIRAPFFSPQAVSTARCSAISNSHSEQLKVEVRHLEKGKCSGGERGTFTAKVLCMLGGVRTCGCLGFRCFCTRTRMYTRTHMHINTYVCVRVCLLLYVYLYIYMSI